ncbi:MAG: ABC transporter permease subunit [Candidatus Kuenenia stuttgartiensis]|jgi:phosphate transport system permease protein|uniref:ABC transmembrane type-1 domain-containing protein n=1 Tax=Kuenenia stuttgartiensis TaxID=174633 RepID=A0A2C9CBS3_KUEST|nr:MULTISPECIES: ABC transporter permease subunit [Kuenenia]MBE7548801.1 ABC transporter permease subunit [Planctomycetia bacterium]MBZ0191498.1 ABC transporter permease subunit [Candidatus Kuenenia stuttgartiensis]MCF6151759.1 ABC transporter permease subunit [Candidatus Kuenenia stuttgartiensis]MCL4727176.1 ABC transporter permease subunit [Candidatus Kuenenia stuttgartiensis]MCZ7622306.1 ABC transporter permease subunit [Candidatus Kuenenia sp.]
MKSLKSRKLTDKTARWMITCSGVATIFVILALFVFIFMEVLPLLKGAKVVKENTFAIRKAAVCIGADEHLEIAYVVYNNGKTEFVSLRDGSIIRKHDLPGIGNAHITSVDKYKDHHVMGMDDGRILTVSIGFTQSFENGKRIISPVISSRKAIHTNEEGDSLPFAVKHIVSREDEETSVTAVHTDDGRLLLLSSIIETSLFGEGEKRDLCQDITRLIKKSLRRITPFIHNQTEQPLREGTIAITALALDIFMDNLYVGTDSGEVICIDIREKEEPVVLERVKVSGSVVSAMRFLLGDISLVIGDSEGKVSSWMKVRDALSLSGWSLKKIHTFQSHNAPVVAIAGSVRDKGFVTADSNGLVLLRHATSEQTLLNVKTSSPVTALAFSQKANGILAADASGALYLWNISNPHPETTLKTLFGKVWYEGYEKPEYIWQSTGGTDDFEPKFSLIPLIFGTIKGTVYALLIAVPIGIFGALYTSQFLHRSLKVIKPVIELMAALPSVILGFLAGLWLAPLIEKIFPALVIMPFFIVLSISAAMIIWKVTPLFCKSKYKHGVELVFLIPFIISAIFGSICLSGVFESFAFGGDYRQWLLHVLGLHYDQRNAVVVGFAMGFAVIPLVFTISEDAMSNVPGSLIFASLALGATPWQTAMKIVLPTASPAIFSAVMIGFGRAVGETMIVLMATGNTPVMDWNLFSGFRALAANIAVEIPEAPFGGTLYRVLFLASLLLFVTTFIVNTLAEVVRQKMKKKYSKL